MKGILGTTGDGWPRRGWARDFRVALVVALGLIGLAPPAAAVPSVATYIGSPGGTWEVPLFWVIAPPPVVTQCPMVPNNQGACLFTVLIPDGRLNLSTFAQVTLVSISPLAELSVNAGSLEVLTELSNGGTLNVSAAGSVLAASVDNGGTLRVTTGGSLSALDLVNLDTIELATGFMNIAALTNTAGAEIRVEAGASSLNSGVVNNAGKIRLIDAGSTLTAVAGLTELFGNGQLELESSTAVLTSSGVIANRDQHVIRGLGNILATSFVNDSVVQADDPGDTLGITAVFVENTGALLALNGALLDIDASSFDSSGLIESSASQIEIDLSGGTLDNSGTMRAVAGTLDLRSLRIDNAGGSIEAQAGALLDLTDVDLQAGSISVDASSSALMNGTSVLGDLVKTGDVQIGSGTLALLGTLDHTDRLLLADGVITQWGPSAGPPLLTGTGSLVLQGSNTFVASAVNARNDALHTIEGQGVFQPSFFTNDGLVTANLAGQTLVFESIDQAANRGTLRAENGGRLLIRQNTAKPFPTIFNAGGTVEALDGSLVDFRAVFLRDGQLSTLGTGIIRADTFASFTNTTLSGLFQVLPASQLVLGGATQHVGEIQVFDTGRVDASADGVATPILTGLGGIHLQGPNSALFASQDLLHDTDRLLRGQGLFQADSWTNRGTVDADVFAGVLDVRPNTQGTNEGVLRASNGGTLRFGQAPGAGFPTIVNTGAVIEAEDASVVEFAPAFVVGGTLRTTGSGVLRAAPFASLANTTIDGLFEVIAGARAVLEGTTDHTGLIRVFDTGVVDLAPSAANSPVLTGAGMLRLEGPGAQLFASIDLLHDSQRSLLGQGRFQADFWTNRGLMHADTNGGTLAIAPNIQATNEGVLRASGGGTLRIEQATANSPFPFIVNTGGTIEALDGSAVDFAPAIVQNGNLRTTGSGVLRATPFARLIDTRIDGSFHVGAGAELVLEGMTTHDGQIRILQDALLSLTLGAATPRFTGTGRTTLEGPNARAFSSANLVHDARRILEGEGLFQADFFEQRGLVDANVSGGTLRVAVPVQATNLATMRASNGGTLRFQQAPAAGFPTWLNAGGVIEALDQSVVELFAAFVRGGTLRTAGSGLLRADTFLDLTNVVIDGHLETTPNTSLFLRGTTTHHGLMEVRDGSFVQLDSAGGAARSLSGSGTTRLVDTNTRFIAAGPLAEHGAGHTIAGQGRFDIGLSLDNAGSIVADVPTGTLSVFLPSNLNNTGELRAENGGTLSIEIVTNPPSVVNTGGTVEAAAGSTLRLNNVFIVGGTVAANGGTLMGNATIISDLAANGRVAPGLSAGLLTIQGDYLETPANTLSIELDGTQAGVTHDLLRVKGASVLAGELEVSVLAGLAATLGPIDVFTVLDSDSIAGSFSNVSSGSRLRSLDSLWSFTAHYGVSSSFDPTNVVLADFQSVPEPAKALLLALGLCGLAFQGSSIRRHCDPPVSDGQPRRHSRFD